MRIETTEAVVVLSEGSYRWRVSALTEDEIASQPSPLRDLGIGREIAAVSAEVIPTAPMSVEKKEDPAGNPDVFYVGPRLAFYTNFASVISPRFGLGAGYRLPMLAGLLRLGISGSYYTASTSVSQGTLSATSTLHAVPLQFIVYAQLPTDLLGMFDLFDILVGLGADVTISYATVSTTNQPVREVTDVLAGFVGTVGIERWIGVGGLFAELAFSLGSSTGGLVEVDANGMTVRAGYRVYLW